MSESRHRLGVYNAKRELKVNVTCKFAKLVELLEACKPYDDKFCGIILGGLFGVRLSDY